MSSVKKIDLRKQVEYYVNLPYTTTIEKSTGPKGDYYVARVIELPGLIMTGDTPEEALKELEEEKPEFIELYLQLGNKMPEPLKISHCSGKVVLRLPSSVHEDLVKMAAMEGVSLNQYMVAALSKQVGRDEVLMKEKKAVYKTGKPGRRSPRRPAGSS
ncbi:MAG: toxin-antitoxin system HicB family antitoxin [Chloroflexi bacterium]|nr:toxin-antitoxin system HicB family antitoxin [Chloroflexota bacterium]